VSRGEDAGRRLRSAADSMPAPPPRWERIVGTARRRVLLGVVLLAVVLGTGLLAAAVVGRSVRDPDYRVPGIDPRPADPRPLACDGLLEGRTRDPAPLPDVVGVTAHHGADALRKAGVRVQWSASVARECVAVAQAPPGAATVRPGTSVVVSFDQPTGERTLVDVPDVTGREQEDALRMLAEARLVGWLVSECRRHCVVVEQYTDPGTELEAGEAVELFAERFP
jgi:hypothetical protein